MSKITGGEIVARALKNENIDRVFGLIGYQVSSIFGGGITEKLEIIDTRHEQAAVHMADAYATMTKHIGVAIVTGGPGFSNTISGILKAYFSQTPLLVIVGGVAPERKDAAELQDLNQISLVKDYTKWSGTVYDTKRIPEYISMAIRHATLGTKGPCVLEIPVNYLRQEVESSEVNWVSDNMTHASIYPDENYMGQLAEVLKNAKKPILTVGPQAYYQNAGESLKELAEALGIPVFTIHAARGLLQDSHPLCFGTGRTLETGVQNYAYHNADVVIFAGCSIDYSVGGARKPLFGENQTVVQIDVDGVTIGASGRKIDIGIVSDCDIAFRVLKAKVESYGTKEKYKDWVAELTDYQTEIFNKISTDAEVENEYVNPYRLIKRLDENLPEDSVVVLDGSNAMLWSSLLLKCNQGGHQYIAPSGSYGPMGTGLPIALGAAVASSGKTVVLYTGDGSFGFNLSELHTAVRFGLPVVIIVHNDNAWGFCKDTQRVIYGEDKCGFGTELGFVRYDKVCESFGGNGYLVEKEEAFLPAFQDALKAKKVSLINVIVDKTSMSPGTQHMNSLVK